MPGALHDEIEKVFHDFTHSVGLGHGRSNGNALMSPVINVAETDKALEITAELPGVDQQDVDVTVIDNRLTIQAEKKIEEEDKSKNYHVVERSYGKYARFNNGILTVPCPNCRKSRPRLTR